MRSAKLSKQELVACQNANIDLVYGQFFKHLNKEKLKTIPAISEYGDMLTTSDSSGICSLLPPKSNIFDILIDAKKCFEESGLLLFVLSDDANKNYLATIRGKDELDIVKWRKTNGINYGIKNHDLVLKLIEWKKKYGMSVLQAGMDFVQVRFNTMPADMNAFSKEVYEFCPDIVTQGAGDLETLKAGLIEIHGVYLWWD